MRQTLKSCRSDLEIPKIAHWKRRRAINCGQCRHVLDSVSHIFTIVVSQRSKLNWVKWFSKNEHWLNVHGFCASDYVICPFWKSPHAAAKFESTSAPMYVAVRFPMVQQQPWLIGDRLCKCSRSMGESPNLCVPLARSLRMSWGSYIQILFLCVSAARPERALFCQFLDATQCWLPPFLASCHSPLCRHLNCVLA